MSDTTPKKTVLLVDDEVEFLEYTAKALRRRDFEVLCAESGVAALERLAAEEVDIVVLDVKMPGLSGVDVFEILRRERPNLPVIMLTGHGSVQQAFQTSKDGIYDYLAKPFEIEELARILRNAVETPRSAKRVDVSPSKPESIRVLLIDDELELLNSLESVLTRRGMLVATATSGERALDIMTRQAFDVAVVDVKMPGMDGFELLGRIKTLYPSTQVIILTGHPSTEKAVSALWAGVFDYLAKPIDSEELVERIRDARRNRQLQIEKGRADLVSEILAKRPVD